MYGVGNNCGVAYGYVVSPFCVQSLSSRSIAPHQQSAYELPAILDEHPTGRM